MNPNPIDWKLWLLTSAFALGTLGWLADLTICHWLPSKDSGVCHSIAADLSAFGKGVAGLPMLQGTSADAGIALPATLP